MMPLRALLAPTSCVARSLIASAVLAIIGCGGTPKPNSKSPFHKEAQPDRDRDWPMNADDNGGFVYDDDASDGDGESSDDDDFSDDGDETGDESDDSVGDDPSDTSETTYDDYGDDDDDYGDDDNDYGDDDDYSAGDE